MSSSETEPRLLIVIATYNERQSLPSLIAQLFDLLPNSNLRIIDDNSPDGTGKWCDERASQDSRMTVSHRSGKLGLGSATKLGLEFGIDADYDLVATMDADLSHDPDSMREMYEILCERYPAGPDVLIGSRYVPGGAIVGWPWYRRFSSHCVNLFARFALQLPTKDNTGAFRIYRTSALTQIELDDIKSQGYSYLEELLVLLRKAGASMQEHPITFRDRETGESKVDFLEVVRSLWQIVKLAFR